MLAPAFLAQIQQRFSHEKRARVCVWFDPQEEFRRLLPVFQSHLAKGEPPVFHLLAYDPKAKRGQIWLKQQVEPSRCAAAGFLRLGRGMAHGMGVW